jgi:hypothetical protein
MVQKRDWVDRNGPWTNQKEPLTDEKKKPRTLQGRRHFAVKCFLEIKNKKLFSTCRTSQPVKDLKKGMMWLFIIGVC